MVLWCSELSQELSKCRGQLEETAGAKQRPGVMPRGNTPWLKCDAGLAFLSLKSSFCGSQPWCYSKKHHSAKGKRSAERVFTCPPTWAKAAVSTLYWWALKTEVKELCSLWSSARVAEVLFHTVCYLKAQSKKEQPSFNMENCACVRSPCLIEGGAPCAFHRSSCASLGPWSCACRNSCWSPGLPQKHGCLWRPF